MRQPHFSPENRRILVIDDNPAIHEDFKKILVVDAQQPDSLDDLEARFLDGAEQTNIRSAFELDSAHQGQEGFEKVQEALHSNRPYALAFVDMRMPPGWDGIETIIQIWRIDPRLQIVICTAYSNHSWKDVIARIGNPGNIAVLKKPFDNIEVLQLAEMLAHKWFLKDQIQKTSDTRTRRLADSEYLPAPGDVQY